jgi:hypothetical protein
MFSSATCLAWSAVPAAATAKGPDKALVQAFEEAMKAADNFEVQTSCIGTYAKH